MTKLYTFLNEDKIIEEVRAQNHDEAIARASEEVDYFTDFYSEELED